MPGTEVLKQQRRNIIQELTEQRISVPENQDSKLSGKKWLRKFSKV